MATADRTDHAAADGTTPPSATPDTPIGWWIGILAALIIIVLTGVSLWLSYAHLHDVAHSHGLSSSTARAWAWPATLDLFYLAGELLVLLAALRRRIDWWAISLTVLGASCSIALNVAGVGPAAQPLDYVVAAVPPVASLLAFGALMNQLYRLIRARSAGALTAVATVATQVSDDATTPVVERIARPVTPAAVAQPTPVMPPLPPAPPVLPAAPAPAAAVRQYSDPRCAAIRPLYDNGTRPGTKAMRAAIIAAGLTAPSDGTIRGRIRTEVELHEPVLATYPAAIAA